MAERRPFTPEERQVLADILKNIGRSGHWGPGLFMALSFTLLAGIIVIPFGLRFLHWGRAAIPVVLTVLFTAAMATWTWLMRRRPDGGDGLEADLDEGVAEVERHEATDAIRAIMPEHRERAYFMRLKDGRGMFLGFWSPAPEESPARIRHLPPDLPTYPTAEFEIVRAPRSRTSLGVVFRGPTLSGVKTIEYQEKDPELQLRAFEIVPVAWSEIPKRYG